MKDTFHLIDHPLIQHKLTIMRKTDTSSKDFRELLDEISMLMGYELTRDLPLEEVEIKTPITRAKMKRISGKKLAIVPILRAGLGMVDALVDLIPAAKVGHIGLYRDHDTHLPVEYYCKLPTDIENRQVLVLDPMLATGNSAVDAVENFISKGVKEENIIFVSLISSPEGIKRLSEAYSNVQIITACLDEKLNSKGYILPGLGDAGDRIYNTLD